MNSILMNLYSHRNKCQAEQSIATHNAKENLISSWICIVGVMAMLPMLYIHLERSPWWVSVIIIPFIGLIYYIALICRRDYRACKAYAIERGEKVAIFQELIDYEYELKSEIRRKIALVDAMIAGKISPEEWHWQSGV